ncbi:hypothetical protein ACJX0J_039358, partial [Zea mays]
NHLPLAHLSVESTRLVNVFLPIVDSSDAENPGLDDVDVLSPDLSPILVDAYTERGWKQVIILGAFSWPMRAQLAYKLSDEQCHFIFMLGKYLFYLEVIFIIFMSQLKSNKI